MSLMEHMENPEASLDEKLSRLYAASADSNTQGRQLSRSGYDRALERALATSSASRWRTALVQKMKESLHPKINHTGFSQLYDEATRPDPACRESGRHISEIMADAEMDPSLRLACLHNVSEEYQEVSPLRMKEYKQWIEAFHETLDDSRLKREVGFALDALWFMLEPGTSFGSFDHRWYDRKYKEFLQAYAKDTED